MLFRSEMSRNELAALYENTVRPLREHRTAGIELIQILEAYIANRYSVSKTAWDMHVHRNTMNHYLEKIRTLLPLDLEVPENMLKVQMGLYAMRILDSEKDAASDSGSVGSQTEG